MGSGMTMIPQSQDRSALEQEQFLKILSREEAMARFEAALFPRAIPSETRKLADTLARRSPKTSPPRSTSRRSTVPMSTALPSAPRTSPRPAKVRLFALR
ncbi:hypothetical protein ACVME8_001898 [Bradyrhizobium diazoefficiens]